MIKKIMMVLVIVFVLMVTVAAEETCTDSDGGINYAEKGTTSTCPSPNNPNSNMTLCIEFTDQCINANISNVLLEGYCSNDQVVTGDYECQNGCNNGACIEQKQLMFAVYDQADASDVIFVSDFAMTLQQEGYPLSVGATKLFSEIDATTDLDYTEFTIVVYDGEAVVIQGANVPLEIALSEAIENYLFNTNTPYQVISSNSVPSPNLMDLFAIEDCADERIEYCDEGNACVDIIDYKYINGQCVQVGGSGSCHPCQNGCYGGECLPYHPSNEIWRVENYNNALELTENTDSFNGETFFDITPQIGEDELQSTLNDGAVSNKFGRTQYWQYINFDDSANEGGYVKFVENDDDVAADFLYFASGAQIARYSLNFHPSFKSNIVGDDLRDYEDEKIEILGKEYTIVKARTISSSEDSIELTLMAGSVADTLYEGETKTYTVDGRDYEVTVLAITDSGTIYVKFMVNGESTRSLTEGDSSTLADGTLIAVSDIIPGEAGDVSYDLVEFYLGASKVFLKDTNVADTSSSNSLEVGSEKIDDAAVIITGFVDNSIFNINTIQIDITADDDYFVEEGHSLTEYMDEPQAFLGSWDIKYDGLEKGIVYPESIPEDVVEEPVVEEHVVECQVDEECPTTSSGAGGSGVRSIPPSSGFTRIKTSGSDQYNLEFTDGGANQATVPLAYTSGDSNLRMGDNNDDLVLKGSTIINKNDYLIVSDYSKEDGKRITYALRYKGADKVASGETAVVKFDELGTGKRIEVTFTENPGSIPDAVLKLKGASFGIISASDSSVDDFDILVDLDSDKIIQNDDDVVSINTLEGMKIELVDETNDVPMSEGNIFVTFSTPHENHYDHVVPTPVELELYASNGEVRFTEADGSDIAWVSPSEIPDVKYAYTSRGAKFKWYNPTSDPDELTINYPRGQRLPVVYIVGKSADVCSSHELSIGNIFDDRGRIAVEYKTVGGADNVNIGLITEYGNSGGYINCRITEGVCSVGSNNQVEYCTAYTTCSYPDFRPGAKYFVKITDKACPDIADKMEIIDDHKIRREMRFYEGWNLFPLGYGLDYDFSQDFENNMEAAYIYDPFNQEYQDLFEDGDDIIEELVNERGYVSVWVYMNDNFEMDLIIDLEEVQEKVEELDFEFNEGWNFYVVLPQMDKNHEEGYLNIGEDDNGIYIANNKLYAWDAQHQNWDDGTYTDVIDGEIDEDIFGMPYIARYTENFRVSYTGKYVIPPFPEE
jgi:hypothetical protein